MNKIKYRGYEREVVSLSKNFKKVYDRENFDEALEIAGTLDQRLYDEGLDILKMCKNN